MQFDFIENQHEAQAFLYSIGIIVLSLLSVVSFVIAGGGIVFYFFAVLAIGLGFYMAYHLSRAPSQTQAAYRSSKKRSRGSS